MDGDLRIILIGGTSNIGKSTVAEHLAAKLGWASVSTDRLGRHPGRPWSIRKEIDPRPVFDHFMGQDGAALTAAQLAHYQAMWPVVEGVVRQHLDPAAERVVLEGSGVWPDNVAALGLRESAAIWLTGSPELIADRIRGESRYAGTEPPMQALIDRFIARSQGYDLRMMERVRALGLPSITVTPETTVEGLAEACLDRMVRLG